ncbi:hypothetical protein MPDQ_001833 [Monascus purpureus]|uniref:Copper transport protein n=1 Tax=Monascus purpureus TaxID=5098 RepID=A0A507QNP6_MONPU|nr:hypothetical protein MPDQ_001833 [Monascus purpureus]
MDHSMHHADMDMPGHGHGHGDMDMGGQCKMNMIFTWSSTDLCIIFRQWHIRGPWSLFLSLLAIVFLTAGYEAVRQITRRYEVGRAQRLQAFSATVSTGDHEAADAPASANFPPLPVANATTTTISGESHIHNSSLPLLVGRDHRQAVLRRGKVVLAALYAIQVFYSFFIMLLFMTYNGLVMLAVGVGAFVGYLVFGDDAPATKVVACH